MASIHHYRAATREITVRHGSEGPAHDPYAYVEYIVSGRLNNTLASSATLHMGLGVWLQIGKGAKVQPGLHGSTEEHCVVAFEKFLGCTLKALERACDRIRSRCRQCGGLPFKEVSGYPGETFTLCEQGHVIDSNFDESAVI